MLKNGENKKLLREDIRLRLAYGKRSVRTAVKTEIGEDRGLPIAVRGIEHKLQRHIIRPDGHRLYQVTLVTRGAGVYISEDNTEYALERGSVFMFCPDIPHEYHGTSDDFTTYWVNFDGSGIREMFEYIGVTGSCVYCIDDEYSYNKTALMFDDVHRAYWAARSDENTTINNGISAELDYNKYRENEMIASAAAYRLLCNIGVLLNRCKYGASNERDGELAPVLEMIQKRYMENIGVTDMAEHIGVSVNKIAAMFKKSYGITPGRFLVNTRLNFAELFLRQTEHKTIKQISEMAGFSNSGYFIRVFKSKFGVTPEVYRELFKAGQPTD